MRPAGSLQWTRRTTRKPATEHYLNVLLHTARSSRAIYRRRERERWEERMVKRERWGQKGGRQTGDDKERGRVETETEEEVDVHTERSERACSSTRQSEARRDGNEREREKKGGGGHLSYFCLSAPLAPSIATTAPFPLFLPLFLFQCSQGLRSAHLARINACTAACCGV